MRVYIAGMRSAMWSFFILTANVWAQHLPCSEARIRYSAPSPEFVAKVRIDQTPPPLEGEQQKSPHGARAAIEFKPDFTKKGPWNSTLVFSDVPSRKVLFALKVKDHGTSIDGKWVSDRLYFVEIWWGRIAASEVLVDVETRKIIYHQFAHYGEVTFCEEK